MKWTCERSEAVLADEHARDNVSDAELALDADGRILGLRCARYNVGAYVSSGPQPAVDLFNVHTLSGVYAISAARARDLRDGQHQRHRARRGAGGPSPST
ncbi:MAG: molybdopterin-dependent oxidoreductase [Burkholderiaceae bacterium]|nr:molybdopterin-dependent oxidoreductase [Burkholderiaceae bacterium]